jgi:hypothetical protein
MVTRFAHRSARRRGSLMIELLAAIMLLTAALLPLAYSISSEKRLARGMYQRAIAMEIVDGEIEVLAAGGWRAFTNGVSVYHVPAAAATNLPPGRFIVSVTPPKVRLEWRPEVKGHGGPVVREVRVK